MREAALKINEIFFSLQGESSLVGKPTVFVRVATCNMRCRWCDTRYAFWEGRRMTVSEILDEVSRHSTRYVCLTGGEPLGQRAAIPLMHALLARGYTVSLETGGGFSVRDVPEGVIKIIDVKCPGSGETEAMEWSNLELASADDQLKFVIASREDFDWAVALIRDKGLADRCALLFSPVFGQQDPEELADWVLHSGLPLTFQKQLHKDLWGERRGV